jgi:23S rRNA (uracil1939-C5)-methyltransferase
MQLAEKRSILEEVLRRTGRLTMPEIEIRSAEPWQYRNRTQLHIRNGRVGYLKMGTHELCPVDHCPISSPHLNKIIGALDSLVRDRRWPSFIRRVELFSNETELQFNVIDSEQPPARRFFDWAGASLPGHAQGAIAYTAAGERFRVSPRSFFQVNRFLIDSLVNTAVEGASGTTALDLYAGVGLFSLRLARSFTVVTAVESSGSAVADLRFNAQRAGLPVTSVRSDVGDYLSGLAATPDFILADPPREGLGREVVRHLLRIPAPRLHIISCDPSTLGRDLRQLLDGGYRLERLALVDLFPQTYHIETVACCVRD